MSVQRASDWWGGETHALGLKCMECGEVLVPDECCPNRPHGSTYQEADDWARQTWPRHQCYRNREDA